MTIMFAQCLATVSPPQDYLLEQTLALSIFTWNEVDPEVNNLADGHLDALSLASFLPHISDKKKKKKYCEGCDLLFIPPCLENLESET